VSISVVLADDHALVRESLVSHCAATADVRVVAALACAEDAVEAVIKHEPDVVLLDIDMPGIVAFDAARRIKSACAHTRVIILSAFSHDHYIEQALAAGASGYLSKSETLDNILRAIRGIAAGSEYFSPEIQARIVVEEDRIHISEPWRTRLSQITKREMETLQYLVQGLSNKEIAKQMGIAVRTVDNHIAALMATLNIHERVNLARFAIREKIAEA
jgi:DNA-binding NarL/FixJ family response regulator